MTSPPAMRRMRAAKRLLVFAKAPRAGSVKTRLAPLLGAHGAADLQAKLIEHTLEHARIAAAGALELHADFPDDRFLIECAARHDAMLVPQRGADLGERMRNAFARALVEERRAAAVLIGVDCPALTAAHLQRALEVLGEGHDAVIAPAEDGGYVLIGLARFDSSVFEGIAWSTDAVMEQTRERLRALRWRWCELETLWDVDRPADYARLIDSRPLAGALD